MLQVRDLEGELEGELRRSAEAQREARRLERGIKELTYQVLQETTPGICSCSSMCTFQPEMAFWDAAVVSEHFLALSGLSVA